VHLLFKSRKLSHTADRYLLTVIYRENGKGVQRNIIRIGQIQPLFQWVVTVAASFMSIIFLLFVKQTSYRVIRMTDWLFLLLKHIDVIIKTHLKVLATGTAPLLHQVSAETYWYFWGSNISLPCGAQNGYISK